MPDPKPTKESLSKTPSWVMLGFVIGCIVALTVKRDLDARDKTAATAAAAAAAAKAQAAQIEAAQAPPKPATPPAKLSLSDLEAVFQRWQSKAVWRHEITEVAYWDPTTNKYSEFVEVLRSGEDLYFRSIPRLTRPLIDEDVDSAVPIRFTELEEMRAARRAPFMIPPH